MSRLCPTADTACSDTASRGRADSRPRAGRPAAMAPLVTMMTRWPIRRTAATSAQNLAMAASSISPSSVVIDDEPTLATTIIDGRRPRPGMARRWVPPLGGPGHGHRNRNSRRRARMGGTYDLGSARSLAGLVVLVVEHERPDAHRATGPGPPPPQRPVPAEAVGPTMRFGERLGPRQVGERHGAGRLAPLDRPPAALAHHLVASPDRAVDHELARLG